MNGNTLQTTLGINNWHMSMANTICYQIVRFGNTTAIVMNK